MSPHGKRESTREPDPLHAPAAGRRVWRSLLLSGFALVVALVAFVSALNLGWQRERILALVVDWVQAQLGVEISIGEATGRFSRGIELHDLRIGDASNPLAEIDLLRVRWNVLSLLSSDQWVAESIRIEGWSTFLRQSEEGTWEEIDGLLTRLAVEDSDATASTPALLVRRIEIIDSELTLIVEPRRPVGTEPPTSARPVSLRARIQGTGGVRDLLITPGEPLVAARGSLHARLVEMDSGRSDFDRLAQATIDLETRGQRLESMNVNLDAAGLHATANASGRFDQLDELTIVFETDDLASLGDWIQTSTRLTGRVKARALLAGPTDALAGTAHFEAENLDFDGVHAKQIELDLDVGESLARAPTDLMNMSGAIRFRGRDVDLGRFDPAWAPPGKLDLDVDGDLQSGVLEIHRAELHFAGLDAVAKGRASLEHIDQLSLQFSVADVAPWAHAQLPDLDVRGSLKGTAELAGATTRPIGRVTLHSNAIQFRERRVGRLDLTLERKPNRPAAFELALASDALESLHVKARVDLDRERIDFEASADAETWALFIPGAPVVAGRIEAEGSVERTPGTPLFALKFRSKDTRYEDHSLGRIEWTAKNTSGDRIEVSTLEIDGETGTLGLERPTTIDLRPDGAWSLAPTAFRVGFPESASPPALITFRATGSSLLAAGLETLDLKLEALPMAVASRFLGDSPKLEGSVDGHASWQRSRARGWTRGALEWSEPRIGDVGLDRVVTSWTGAPTAIEFELGTELKSVAPLVVRGKIGVSESSQGLSETLAFDRVSMRADLDDWDLSVLNSLTPTWMRRLAGRVTGRVELSRDEAGHHLNGHAKIANGGFSVPLLRQRFAPIEGSFTLADREWSVESLRIGKQTANATLTGSMSIPIEGSPGLDARVHFDRFPLARSSAAWMDMVGDLQFTGTLERPKIVGTLAIADGKIGVPAADDPVLKEIRIATQTSNDDLVEPDETTRKPFGEAAVDIAFSVPDTTRVRGQGANLFVEGTARATKRPDEALRLQAEARVANGTYTFQGRTFLVRRGRVTLTGDERLDPVLDVEARLPVSDIVAIIELTGRLSSPIIRLSSDPPRSDQDVLSYLLFGRSADEVTVAGNTRFEAAAARLVAGVAEQELRDVLGDAMPVDSIEIGADTEGNTSEFGFGKYLSPKLFIRYLHVLGDEPSDRVGIEYRLSDVLSLGSSVSTTGETGLDLIFRHDF